MHRFLSTLSSLLIVTCALAADPPVTGTFTANGKPAKLAFVRAVKGDGFDGKPTTVLVITEKDASKDDKPDFHASFGKFGNSLTITVFPDGQIIGCEVSHTALSHKNFSSVGNIKTADFKMGSGTIECKILTDGEIESLGEKWEVNLTVKTKAP